MGRRSDFTRIDKDAYDTPISAVQPLLRHLHIGTHFVEPCGGKGALTAALEAQGFWCTYTCDIAPRAPGIIKRNALDLGERDVADADMIITNPPWTRPVLHELIEHLRRLRPTWLLFDANWMFTQQAAQHLRYCSKIVTVGRVKWIEGSAMTGKDDAAWFKFESFECQTVFIGKSLKIPRAAVGLETVTTPALSPELIAEYIEMFGLIDGGVA